LAYQALLRECFFHDFHHIRKAERPGGSHEGNVIAVLRLPALQRAQPYPELAEGQTAVVSLAENGSPRS